jgi:hypothetical protein
MKNAWIAALCVVVSLAVTAPALAALQPDPGPATGAGVGLRPDSFGSAAQPAQPSPSTDATIPPVTRAVPVTKPPITKPAVETPPVITQPVEQPQPPAAAVSTQVTGLVEQTSEPPRAVATSAGSAAAASTAAGEKAEQRVPRPALPVHLESLRLPYLGGSLTLPPVPSVDDADRLVLPAALALLTLVAASGGFLGLVYRLGRERARLL